MIALILALSMVLALCACGTDREGSVAETSVAAGSAEETIVLEASEADVGATEEAVEESVVEAEILEESEVSEEPEEDPEAVKYQEALNHAQNGEYVEALTLFRELGNYEDAAALRKSCAYSAIRAYLKENGAQIVALEDLSDPYTYGLYQDVDGSSNVYVALNDNEDIILGIGRNATNDFGFIRWTFYIEVKEDSNIANACFLEASVMSLLGNTVKEVVGGTMDLDICIE